MGAHSQIPEQPEDGTVHPLMALVTVVFTIGLVVMFFFAASSDRVHGRMNIQGDSLGPEGEESVSEYVARADESLSEAEGEENRWALVSFDPPVSPLEIDAIVPADVRVARALAVETVPVTLPEPIEGMTRSAVIEREFEFRTMLAGEDPALGIRIVGLLVWADAEQLHDMRSRATAVEALPTDAVVSRLGVRGLNQ